MSKHNITIEINGESVTREIDSRKLLIHFLRDDLALTGTHIGCDTSSCGACTVLLMESRSRPVISLRYKRIIRKLRPLRELSKEDSFTHYRKASIRSMDCSAVSVLRA